MSEPPRQVGPYQIVRELGRGGMGIVWLATDVRLGREVAIKALPDALAHDTERLERFEREARLLARLDHPNIARLHGLEEHEGRRYLVLEYVPGVTLEERLDAGPLPIDEAVDVALRIARGVEAAHDSGIVHRDLKPANIRITPEGEVKVLDFGLARSSEGDSTISAATLPDSPTLAEVAPNSPTIPGLILGTAPYMSPEQARGRRVDRGSDLWSFGVILYEMLTTIRPFAGETVSDSIGAILHRDVDLDRLPAETPEALRRLLRRCLERDRGRRLRDAGAARIELEEALAEPAPVAERARAGTSPLALAGWFAALLLAGLTGWLALRDAGSTSALVRSAIVAPEGIDIHRVVIAPDGRRVAFLGFPSKVDRLGIEVTNTLYLRELGDAEAALVPESAGVFHAAFSPDGTTLAYITGRSRNENTVALRRVPVDLSAPPVTIRTISSLFDTAGQGWFCWSPEGRIVLIDRTARQLVIVDPGTGREVRRVAIDTTIPDPDFGSLHGPLGDRHVSVTLARYDADGLHFDIAAIDLDTGAMQRVLEDGADPQLAPDGRTLLFTRGDTLFTCAFDADRLELAGAYAPVQGGLTTGATWLHGEAALAGNGTLCYLRGSVQGAARSLALIDAEGDESVWFEETRAYEEYLAVSPDGERVAVTVAGPGGLFEVWVGDTESARMRRLVGAVGADCYGGVFTPDGAALVIARWAPDDDEPGTVMLVPFAGDAPPRRIWGGWTRDQWIEPLFVDPKGTRAWVRAGGAGQEELIAIDLAGATEPRSLLTVPFLRSPALAPREDVPLLAYISDETGRPEAMLRSVGAETLGPAIPISTDGAWRCGWSLDAEGGLRLHHFDLEQREWITPVTWEGRPRLGTAVRSGRILHERIEEHALLRDGRIAVMLLGPDEGWPTRIELVQGWWQHVGASRR